MSEQTYRAVMLDIETLGTTAGAAILSVGAVSFEYSHGSPEGCEHSYGWVGKETGSFYGAVSLADAARGWDPRIDPATVAWWLQREASAREAVLEGTHPDLRAVLQGLSEFVLRCRGAPTPREAGFFRVWSHGVGFDTTLLEAAYRAHSLPVPWRHWEVRDTRTTFELAGVSLADYRSGTHHHALDDARTQLVALRVAVGNLFGEV